jgi:hypothetical protein
MMPGRNRKRKQNAQPSRRGGEWNTMVMMFVGGVVLMLDRFFVLFLPYNIYGAGVYRSPEPIGVKLLTALLHRSPFWWLGMKNSRSEGFWLAKHKHTNIPTMMEPFSPPATWF